MVNELPCEKVNLGVEMVVVVAAAVALATAMTESRLKKLSPSHRVIEHHKQARRTHLNRLVCRRTELGGVEGG